jgi:hypothetical protein
MLIFMSSLATTTQAQMVQPRKLEGYNHASQNAITAHSPPEQEKLPRKQSFGRMFLLETAVFFLFKLRGV